VTWGALRNSLFAGPNAWLKQLVLVFTIACLLTCAYLWQSSAIAAIQKDTRRAEVKSAQLERTNVVLMLQVAQWNSPAHIREKARQGKLTPAPAPLVIEAPIAPAAAPAGRATDPAVAQAAILWRQLLAQIAEPADAVARDTARAAGQR
jgi:ABC-type nickel/cobalt efflux system permease component RcnA